MGAKRNVYSGLVGKPDGKTPLGRRRHRLEDNITAKSGWGHGQLAGTVNTVINLQVPQNARNLPTSWGTINFSRRILFCGVSDIPTEISQTVEVHMVHTFRSLTDWNNFRCRGGYDLSWLDVILFASWGLCPNALHGASSRILSNDSGLNGGPWSTNLCCSCGSGIMWTLFVESYTKVCTLQSENCWQRFTILFTLDSVLSRAMMTPYKVTI